MIVAPNVVTRDYQTQAGYSLLGPRGILKSFHFKLFVM